MLPNLLQDADGQRMSRLVTRCDALPWSTQLIASALGAHDDRCTGFEEVRLDQLVFASMDLDRHEIQYLSQFTTSSEWHSSRTSVAFHLELTRALSDCRLWSLFCRTNADSDHRNIVPCAYDERTGRVHGPEMAQWRATFRSLPPEAQIICATVVWLYRGGPDSIWLRRVPCSWRADEALAYMRDAGVIEIWLALLLSFPGW